ncbi:hypothetical protein B0H16DRAFT_239753 [Mycena metata]|uniref:Uncharacterized protein n=1 Tax=Mycena metata TaxID=1033252 RepID=A0AAD7HW94_9AGAR|nr:hypothetical protein B0H16DRAFT_239753 [Mycena metata]
MPRRRLVLAPRLRGTRMRIRRRSRVRGVDGGMWVLSREEYGVNGGGSSGWERGWARGGRGGREGWRGRGTRRRCTCTSPATLRQRCSARNQTHPRAHDCSAPRAPPAHTARGVGVLALQVPPCRAAGPLRRRVWGDSRRLRRVCGEYLSHARRADLQDHEQEYHGWLQILSGRNRRALRSAASIRRSWYFLYSYSAAEGAKWAQITYGLGAAALSSTTLLLLRHRVEFILPVRTASCSAAPSH